MQLDTRILHFKITASEPRYLNIAADCWGLCTPVCAPTSADDGACTPGEPGTPASGDGTCSNIESCRLCPLDCGACTALCGDAFCDAPETAATCPGDCTP